MSDRHALFHGVMDLDLSFESHAPHTGSVRDSDQGTASSPAASDAFSEFFDYPGYVRGEPTDATTPSDVLSDGKSAASPPFVTPDGAAATPNSDEDCLMTDAPSVEPQQSDVWPRAPGPHPPRDLNIQVDTLPSPSTPSSEMHLDGPSQGLPPPNKKTRALKDPQETSQVRDCGACSFCRMSKSGCDPSKVCSKCEKRPLSERVCIRTQLQDIIPPKFARWNWNDPTFFMPGREQFVKGRALKFLISFSESAGSPSLELEACPFALPNQTEQGSTHGPPWGIVPGGLPSEAIICDWIKRQIEAEPRRDFEAEMDRLLLGVVRRAETGPYPNWLGLEPLASDILKMRCMWKVWSCKQLFGRTCLSSRETFGPFELRFAAIQDSLRMCAAQAISELERKILPEIQKLAIKAKTDDADVMKWLLLWQMMLVYRQSLGWMWRQEQTNAAPVHLAVMPENENRHAFRDTTRRLFEAIVVIYAGVYQKGTVVNRIRDVGFEAFGDRRLHEAYQRIWKSLPNFYQQVSSEVSPTDEVFKKYIVNKEALILARAHPASR